MGIENSITASSIIALDSNIFMYARNEDDPHHEAAKRLLEKIIHTTHKVFVSVMVFEEFLVKIYEKNLDKDLASYEDFLTAGGLITVVDMDRQVARMAAKLRADSPSLKTPDAIHLASALVSGATLFITGEKRLPRKIGKLAIKVLH